MDNNQSHLQVAGVPQAKPQYPVGIPATRGWSTEQWESHLGEQVRRARLNEDISQQTLAEHANVALGAVKRLEAGQGSTLRTLVRVSRVLGKTEWLRQFEPDPGISPMELLRAQQASAPPQRASRKATKAAKTPNATPEGS